MTGHEKSFRTTDGALLVYDDFGSGPAVLLVHGFTRRAAHWAFQREALVAAGYRTVALDLRFHGRSDSPESRQRVSPLGKDVGELIEHLELDQVALVGHSLGVSVCLAYCLTDFPPGAVLHLMVDHFTADWRDVVPIVNVSSLVVTGRYSPSFPLEGMQWFAETLPDCPVCV